MSNTSDPSRRLLAAATLAAGLALGLAANAGAQPAGDDFWECAGDHQDTDGIGVCCVFYGGDYDERSGECLIDDAAAAEATRSPDAGPTKPTVKPGIPVLTQSSTSVPSKAIWLGRM
jgi:nitrite reductase/ring-hydroxylating ferredoxin subunit